MIARAEVESKSTPVAGPVANSTVDVLSAPGGLPIGRLYEGPYWNSIDSRLWWVDIELRTVFCFSEESRTVRQFLMPEKVSAVVAEATGGFLVTGERHLWRLEPTSERYEALIELSGEPQGNRCNDAKCDPYGNLWISTMDNDERAATGNLWCLTSSGHLLHFLGSVGIGNTLAWDTMRRRMYFGDSMVGAIYMASYELVDGVPEPGKMSVFAEPNAAPGVPDGSAIDEDGNLWNARWDGNCVACLDPDGRVKALYPIGACRPTSCAFIGSRLDVLAITTASAGLDSGVDCARDGRVLTIRVNAVGSRVPHYMGDCKRLF